MTLFVDVQWSSVCTVSHRIFRPNHAGVMAKDRAQGTYLGFPHTPAAWFRNHHPVCVPNAASHKNEYDHHFGQK